MILPDCPIEDKDADKLRRAPLASKVAELIKNFQGKESFVIGIEGVWGSGKTSFINLVISELKPENTIVITFNPWNFSGQNELINDFFTTLTSSIEDFRTDKEKAKKIRKIVSKLTRKSEVSISPEISAFYGLVNIKANDLFKFGGDEKTLQDERKEIDELFRALQKKVVIVIDDIDRLDTEETRLVMKLVKMTANFPNTVFLLAYDREKVAEKLGDNGIGEEYLKKIIQVSFTLPKPDEQGLRKILFSDLDETIKGVYGEVKLEGEDEKRWGQIVYAGFPNLFVTIRDIKRFISSLRLNWSIVGKEDTNMIDFIAIEAIRVFVPQFYSAISGNKTLFTSMESSYPTLRADKEKTKMARYQELLKKVSEEIRPVIEKICDELFPQLGSGYGHDWQQNWRREKRISAEERFNFYFQLGIPEGAISETEITELLKTLDRPDDFADSILKFQDDKRLRPLLSKLLDYTNKFTKGQAKNLTVTLWNLESKITDERGGMFDFDDIETQTLRLVYHSIKAAVSKEERGAFLEETVKASTTFYPPVHFIAVLGQELEKEGRSADEYLVQSVDTTKPKEILLQRIKDAVKGGKLPEEKGFVFFLYRWKEWGNEDDVKKYIEELVKTRAGLLAYLKGFVGKVFSSNGNYNRIDKKAISRFLPKETLDTLVQAITSEELAQMGEKEKEAIILYTNPPKQDRWD
ncbi:TPA: AAA family ATPase [Candidatus Woesearchaeota archaeon]|nr:AAA family ATPase [Candidatus Woesearchaeota archaeon]